MRRLCVLAAVALAAAAWAAWSVTRPYRGFTGEAFIEIPRGTSSVRLAGLLSDAGVIRHPWQLLAVRAVRPRARLLAGEYLFQREASPWEIFDRLVRGDVFFQHLTVTEGQNVFDIANSLERLGVMSGAGFLEAARDSSLIRDLAPEARTLEGFLFPDTYRVGKHATPIGLCLQMTERFRRAWTDLGTGKPVYDTVTLASLVEKETAVPAERALVASVFANRLKAGMSLDCDPTAVYAALLEGRYRGLIFRSDLESRHRYNTYQHAGLPPGPIANPGMEALRAAASPAATRYFYFVANSDGSGAHVFSENLDAHQRAVSKYRRGTQKALKARAAGPVSRAKAAGAIR